jgi:hypothetical protein
MSQVDRHIRRDSSGVLAITTPIDRLPDQEIRAAIEDSNFRVGSWAVAYHREEQWRRVTCQVQWKARFEDVDPPPFLERFAQRDDVIRLEWRETLRS